MIAYRPAKLRYLSKYRLQKERASLCGSLLTIYIEILPAAEVGVRSGYRVRAFFAGAIFQVDGVFFATTLTVAEDKPIGANTFFLNQVVDNCIYPIPAELLSGLAGFAIADDSDLTIGVILDLLSDGS